MPFFFSHGRVNRGPKINRERFWLFSPPLSPPPFPLLPFRLSQRVLENSPSSAARRRSLVPFFSFIAQVHTRFLESPKRSKSLEEIGKDDGAAVF